MENWSKLPKAWWFRFIGCFKTWYRLYHIVVTSNKATRNKDTFLHAIFGNVVLFVLCFQNFWGLIRSNHCSFWNYEVNFYYELWVNKHWKPVLQRSKLSQPTIQHAITVTPQGQLFINSKHTSGNAFTLKYIYREIRNGLWEDQIISSTYWYRQKSSTTVLY